MCAAADGAQTRELLQSTHGEPQLAGYMCNHNASNATERADAAPIAMDSQTSSQQTGASSSQRQIVATEHADDATEHAEVGNVTVIEIAFQNGMWWSIPQEMSQAL